MQKGLDLKEVTISTQNKARKARYAFESGVTASL